MLCSTSLCYRRLLFCGSDVFELVDVSFSYNDRLALKSIDLLIESGESVSFLGANGCGKSTLFKLLSGLIVADYGTYSFDGSPVNTKTLADTRFSKRLHQRVGFVFQNPDTQLFCASVYDEVAFGPRHMGLAEAEIEQRVSETLVLLGLSGFENRIPYHLSGGEKRKVALAAVLAMNPDALVLDEPMSGLDPRTMRWLAEFLVQLNSIGKTILVSTHNLDLVQEISSRAVLFDEDHSLAADMPSSDILADIDLLKRVNLVDQYYRNGDC